MKLFCSQTVRFPGGDILYCIGRAAAARGSFVDGVFETGVI